MVTVVKIQALIRGFLARRRVQNIYGFKLSPGLMMRGSVHIEMEPELLE